MPEEGRRESGFTFVELVISMAITALIVPAMFVMLGQLDRLPTRNNAELGASNEVRQAGVWIASDARRALAFDDATDTFTVVGGNVTYQWNPATGDLIRTETGANAMSMAVASNIDAFDLSPGAGSAALVKATLTSTRDAGGVDVSEQTTLYGVMRNLSGGFDSVYKTILTSGGTVDIHADVIIEGNVRAYGPGEPPDPDDIIIKVNAGGNITGDAETTGRIDAAAGTIGGDRLEGVTDLPLPPDPLTPPGGPYILQVLGNGPPVKLNVGHDEVWEDPGVYTRLKPGIYYAPDRTMKLTNDDVIGEVTLIAEKVEVNSERSQLTPYYGGIVLWGTGTGNNVVQVNGSADAVWEGILYAPDGQVHIIAAFTIYGGVVGKNMLLTSSGGEMRIVVE